MHWEITDGIKLVVLRKDLDLVSVDVDRGAVVESLRVATRPERGVRAVLADCVELARTLAVGDAVPAGSHERGLMARAR